MTVLRESEINEHLQRGEYTSAVKIALENAVGRKSPIRHQVASQAIKVLMSVKTGEIDTVVNGLSLDEIDVLMRYVYHGFEHPTEGSSTHLLTWHDKACNKGGVGSIVRVLTEH